MDHLPYTATGTTVGGSDVLNDYSCAPGTDESGPERVYRVTLPGPGSLTVTLDPALESGTTDVDVHILSSRAANACLDRGDRNAFASFTSTTAWVTLDSYVRANGDLGAGAFSAAFTFQAAGNNPLLGAGVPPQVAALALTAYNNANQQNLTSGPIFSVIDFSQPSTHQRLWTVNMDSGELLVHDRVAHGSGSNSPSDPAMASTFSNTPGSNMSSLGLFMGAETYQGTHGYSLRLDGLEPSNSNMRERAIVVHGASYAEDDFVSQNGYLGRSNGCPALAQSRSTAFIDVIKQGSLLFAYFPDPVWLNSSPFLNP